MVSFNRKQLVDALSVVLPAVNLKSDLPVLSTFLFEEKGEEVFLTANNLEMMLQTRFSGSLDGQTIAAPAELLYKLLALMNGDETIEIEIPEKEQNLIIKDHNSITTLKGLPAKDFPPLITQLNFEHEILLAARIFIDACQKVIFAASRDQARASLQGVFFKLSQQTLTMVAIDGFQMAEQIIHLEQPVNNEIEIIVPVNTLKAALELAQKVDEVLLQFSPKYMGLKTEKTQWVSQVVDAKYPDYQKLIPQKTGTKVTVVAESLLRACRGANIFTGGGNEHRVAFILDTKMNSLKVIAQSEDLGQFEIELNAKIDGENMTIYFNNKNLIQYLSHVNGELEIVFLGSKAPCLFRVKDNTDYLYILMSSL